MRLVRNHDVRTSAFLPKRFGSDLLPRRHLVCRVIRGDDDNRDTLFFRLFNLLGNDALVDSPSFCINDLIVLTRIAGLATTRMDLNDHELIAGNTKSIAIGPQTISGLLSQVNRRCKNDSDAIRASPRRVLTEDLLAHVRLASSASGNHLALAILVKNTHEALERFDLDLSRRSPVERHSVLVKAI